MARRSEAAWRVWLCQAVAHTSLERFVIAPAHLLLDSAVSARFRAAQ
jgi:hypothetical protein